MPVDELLAEAEAQPFTGWDFSWLGDRMQVERPWDYTQIVLDAARRAPDLLDMGTGGGEWLADLSFRPRRTIATEGWPPNVAGAAHNLRMVGVPVVRDEGAADNERQAADPPRGRLPFRDGAFHLVVNRHEAFVAGEVARVLAPNGTFVTQQVDNANLDDLYGLFERDRARPRPSWLPLAVEQIAGAGLEITDARAGIETYRFADVGALAWYVAAVGPLHAEWATFTIAAYHDALVRLDERARAGAPLELHQRRLLVQARDATRAR
jgi:SAM-dependent methyltransferase